MQRLIVTLLLACAMRVRAGKKGKADRLRRAVLAGNIKTPKAKELAKTLIRPYVADPFKAKKVKRKWLDYLSGDDAKRAEEMDQDAERPKKKAKVVELTREPCKSKIDGERVSVSMADALQYMDELAPGPQHTEIQRAVKRATRAKLEKARAESNRTSVRARKRLKAFRKAGENTTQAVPMEVEEEEEEDEWEGQDSDEETEAQRAKKILDWRRKRTLLTVYGWEKVAKMEERQKKKAEKRQKDKADNSATNPGMELFTWITTQEVITVFAALLQTALAFFSGLTLAMCRFKTYTSGMPEDLLLTV
eukprot:gnl/MRDRNA2_/MRDRNA2_57383_c0_seq1.p1 gnl/MRDRNA2_/MRDRNA2_57383_c0~~gnl/MRDRNA2_/MRDRNA2_57383_c0_seq1.p1  ORF type:complete len:306 (-),score=82.78 gnl/MRDRNA2_/MRDRNA2_57383_c0_seq1:112-1029(-)